MKKFFFLIAVALMAFAAQARGIHDIDSINAIDSIGGHVIPGLVVNGGRPSPWEKPGPRPGGIAWSPSHNPNQGIPTVGGMTDGVQLGEAMEMGLNEAPDQVFAAPAVTGIEETVGTKTVAAVRYFNVNGQEMREPEGLTIVVTTYTDGTSSAVKVVR